MNNYSNRPTRYVKRKKFRNLRIQYSIVILSTEFEEFSRCFSTFHLMVLIELITNRKQTISQNTVIHIRVPLRIRESYSYEVSDVNVPKRDL